MVSVADGVCTCCRCAVPVNTLQLFEKVLVCPSCHATAERFVTKGEQHLKWMMSVLREGVKQSLIKGELQFRTDAQVHGREVINKKKFLDHLYYLTNHAHPMEQAPRPSERIKGDG